MDKKIEEAGERFFDLNGEALKKAVMDEGRESDCDCQDDLPTLHTIKPLEWGVPRRGNGVVAHTPIGLSYFVSSTKKGYRWDYVPDNDDECDSNLCTSIEDGKEKAREHYEKQLGKCLEVYDG